MNRRSREKGSKVFCERCGKSVVSGEHIDLENGVAVILCRDCLEYLSAHEAKFDEFVQQAKSNENSILC